MNSTFQQPTLAELLKPYNRSEIARHVGATRTRVNRWATGQGFPEVKDLPRLAEVLRIDVSTLTDIIASSAPVVA